MPGIEDELSKSSEESSDIESNPDYEITERDKREELIDLLDDDADSNTKKKVFAIVKRQRGRERETVMLTIV